MQGVEWGMNIGNAAFQTSVSRVDVFRLSTCQQLRVIHVGMVAYGELISDNVEVLCVHDED